MITHGQFRRSSLGIPATEVGQINTGGIFHSRDKIVAGNGLPIVAVKVQIAAGAEFLFPEERVDHTNHFRSLLIHGERVEVRNLDEGGGSNRMGHGPCVFGELHGSHDDGIFDALQGTRAHIRRELCVAEYGETLFQRQLKPVAAGYAVAGPVVEVLVTHNALDALIPQVRCGFWAG